MKRMKMMLLFVSLFAVAPAVLGSAWGIENRDKHGMKQECQLRTAKRLANNTSADATKKAKQASETAAQ
jgi:hypothetical protein